MAAGIEVLTVIECACTHAAVGIDFRDASALSARILTLLRSCGQANVVWRAALTDGMFPHQLGNSAAKLHEAMMKNEDGATLPC